MVSRVPVRLLLAAAVLIAAGSGARAETAARRAIRVALAPVVNEPVSGVAWMAMVEECTRIWALEGVSVVWAGDDPGAHVVLPIVFDDREVRRHDPKDEDALGVTLFAGRSQRILVSVARARYVVAQRQGLADSRDGATLDIVAGRILGRVVAHELGHALLLTTRHATHGLMRAQIDARDLRPRLGAEFALSRPERDRLAVRFSNRLPPGSLALAGFTWTDVPPAPSRLHAPR